MIGEMEGGFEIEFNWDNPKFTFAEILEAAGNIPIPPYLHRESEEIDLSVYQTVYAKIRGSVAAPTAGLHFTDKVFRALAKRQISCEELTLHVGAGTFQPVKCESVGEHRMHTEYFSVNKSTISKLIAHPGSVIAVGTTSVRTLESLYWIGVKIVANPSIDPDSLAVTQWEPYQERGGDGAQTEGLGDFEIGRVRRWEGEKMGRWEDERASVPERSRGVALQAILDWMDQRKLLTLETATQIMILPGYRFRIIGGLVTNFHQPQSTLLLLISAILGDDWKRVYAHALEKGYRFLSYGDANLYFLP
jgi:S-adenosylmethionine:tRNA ribosyltransferase-isomerase